MSVGNLLAYLVM